MNISPPRSTLFRRLASLLAKPSKIRRRWRQRWQGCWFQIEAHGRLRSFQNDGGLRLDVPARVANAKGTLHIGANVTLGYRDAPLLGDGHILLSPRAADSIISIGAETILSNNVAVVAMESITIGRACLIGDQTQIFDCDFHEIDPERRHQGHGITQPVVIEDNVWLGSRVLVLKGVTIGKNSVIAAGSVVTRSIEANVVAAGVPARPLRSI